MELFRDHAAEAFERHTGSSWRPRAGSKINHRALTAAMIDSRDFLAAKRRAAIEPLLPAGPKIAFTGGLDFNDHRAIWDRLDKALAKHPNMVLLHGGSTRGAERIAAHRADSRKVPQIVFRPDWARHAKAAPFKRNDQMLEAMPIGGVPGLGYFRQSRRQVEKAGHCGLELMRSRLVRGSEVPMRSGLRLFGSTAKGLDCMIESSLVRLGRLRSLDARIGLSDRGRHSSSPSQRQSSAPRPKPPLSVELFSASRPYIAHWQ